MMDCDEIIDDGICIICQAEHTSKEKKENYKTRYVFFYFFIIIKIY